MPASQAKSINYSETAEIRDLTFGIYDTLTDHHHCYADVVLAPAGEDGEPDWAKADPANVRKLPADEWPEDEPSAPAACVLVSDVAGCDQDATQPLTLHIRYLDLLDSGRAD
ncbi:hypothetical protein [Bradyrhizobium ottawaense]|uniref:hypothetical protein n=1 Tax=Bradyrhizobium ottawaense TaxID=931866 RepID=UPI00041F607A|nr:hypothetical protein [Bradyrhizobium ottawaense]